MRRVFWVAWREFAATALTKSFLLGIFLPPIFMAIAMLALPMLMNQKAPKVTGHVAVIDQSGVVAGRLEKFFSAEEVRKRREERFAKVKAMTPVVPGMDGQIAQAEKMANDFMPEPDLKIVRLDPGASVDDEKKPILAAEGKEKDAGGGNPRLGLVVVPMGAVKPEKAGVEYGGFRMFVTPRLDIEVQNEIESQVQRAVVDARIEAKNYSVDEIRAMVKRPDVTTKSVTASGDTTSSEVAKILLPGAFMFLMFMSVMLCGQGLLSSTIEEKSTRVMELLLSAVTPMQLMMGKILGQMAVGLLVMAIYAGTGVSALAFFAMMAQIDLMNLVWLLVFFVIAFGMIASLFAAVGSAVNDIREAQTLQTPVMILLVIPMMLWMPIMRNPNSVFAQVVSFVPPIGPFVMVLRLAGSEKIPSWQLPVSIVVGVVSVVVFMWAAAKIFRVGVLMYGKPPNFLTLLKWIRMA